MRITRRIYFSVPTRVWNGTDYVDLTSAQQDLIRGLADKIKQIGYAVEVFAQLGIATSLTAMTSWTYEDVDRVMRHCVGAVFIGLPRWILTTAGNQQWRMATEFSYYEAGVAVTLGLPRLVLAEDGLLARAVFDMAYKDWIATFPENAGPDSNDTTASSEAAPGVDGGRDGSRVRDWISRASIPIFLANPRTLRQPSSSEGMRSGR